MFPARRTPAACGPLRSTTSLPCAPPAPPCRPSRWWCSTCPRTELISGLNAILKLKHHHVARPTLQAIPLVVQHLPMLGQRLTYIRAFLWAMPERCQQVGRARDAPQQAQRMVCSRHHFHQGWKQKHAAHTSLGVSECEASLPMQQPEEFIRDFFCIIQASYTLYTCAHMPRRRSASWWRWAPTPSTGTASSEKSKSISKRESERSISPLPALSPSGNWPASSSVVLLWHSKAQLRCNNRHTERLPHAWWCPREHP